MNADMEGFGQKPEQKQQESKSTQTDDKKRHRPVCFVTLLLFIGTKVTEIIVCFFKIKKPSQFQLQCDTKHAGSSKTLGGKRETLHDFSLSFFLC